MTRANSEKRAGDDPTEFVTCVNGCAYGVGSEYWSILKEE